MAVVASYFPSTLYSVKRKLFESQYFTRFVVCRKCWTLYHFGECINISGPSRSSKECNHVQFPNHPFAYGRVPCKQCLLKTIKYPSGKTIFYPFKIFVTKVFGRAFRICFIDQDLWKVVSTGKLDVYTYDKICDMYEGRV